MTPDGHLCTGCTGDMDLLGAIFPQIKYILFYLIGALAKRGQ